LFEAPEIIRNIPDIKAIYDMNEKQGENLETEVERMDNNLFLESMDEAMTARWEAMLEITKADNDTLQDRRFRIKSRVLERRPYTEKAIGERLKLLCPDGFSMSVDEKRQQVTIKLALKSQKMVDDVKKYMEDILPLNMTFSIDVLWNQYKILTGKRYADITKYTYGEMREKVIA